MCYADYNRTAVTSLCANSVAMVAYDPTQGARNRETGKDGIFVVEAVRGWCDACVHGATGDASKFTNMDLQVDNLYAMGYMVRLFGVRASRA